MAGRRGFGTIRKLPSGRWQALYWLDGKTALRPRTVELYEYLLRSHLNPTFGTTPLSRISSSTVRTWNSDIRAGSISETTASKAYRLLRQIMQTAVDDRLVRQNPCQVKGAAVKRSKERQIPSLEEVNRLADSIEPRYRAMVLLAAYAGLRKGECLGLARRHVDLEANPPSVKIERARLETEKSGLIFQDPKTVAGVRNVALPAKLAEEIGRHLDEWVDEDMEALLFTAPKSGDTPTKTVWRRAWGKARSEAQVSCTFHDLRHVAGTLNAAAGATIKEAMARLGHSSSQAALRYQHAVEERDGEIAAEIDRLMG